MNGFDITYRSIKLLQNTPLIQFERYDSTNPFQIHPYTSSSASEKFRRIQFHGDFSLGIDRYFEISNDRNQSNFALHKSETHSWNKTKKKIILEKL